MTTRKAFVAAAIVFSSLTVRGVQDSRQSAVTLPPVAESTVVAVEPDAELAIDELVAVTEQAEPTRDAGEDQRIAQGQPAQRTQPAGIRWVERSQANPNWPTVTVYSADNCPHCRILESWFNRPEVVAQFASWNCVYVHQPDMSGGVPRLRFESPFGLRPREYPGRPASAKGLARLLWAEWHHAMKQTPVVPVESVLPADNQPTPMEAVGAGLAALDLKPSDVFADLGCGFDCRWGITAARLYGCRVIAMDVDPAMVESARRYVEHAGLSHLITVYHADATTARFNANKGAGYLWEETLGKLAPRIKQMDRFVSFAHEIPGVQTRELGNDLYVYQKPQPRPYAVYGGRKYTRPVCNSPSCSMCAAIRRQLGAM